MAATGEVVNPAGDATKAVEQQPPATEKKAVKEKKPKAPKEKKPKSAKTVTHPPYFQMIKEALVALNEKGGSSPYAIAKYMEDKHKAELPANFRKTLGLQLKNSAAKGKLNKIKASYKLSGAGKKDTTKKIAKAKSEKKPRKAKATTAAAAKKTEVTKKAAKKTEVTKKAKPTTQKVGAKKMKKKATPAKPKQPKSIKSPAAKRARKVTA